MDVTFFLAEGELEGLRALDPDRDWRELQRGERAWVLQTYLRLARAGYPARLANQLPPRGLVVFHLKQRRALPSLGRPPARHRRQLGQGPLFLGIRSDLRASRAADFEVVQNRRSAEHGRSFFIPHWPQPGLRPRDPARGAAVARLAYKGFDRNLHPYFRTPDWSAFLASRGIEWVIDSVPFAEGSTDRTTLDWPDFRAVDAVLAVRPDGLRRRDGKPATKLYNAWLAGIPALLGPDEAFAEIRRSPLDYLDVARPEEAKRAVGGCSTIRSSTAAWSPTAAGERMNTPRPRSSSAGASFSTSCCRGLLPPATGVRRRASRSSSDDGFTARRACSCENEFTGERET